MPPIGYVKTPAGGLALDPDEQVRAVVRLIFDKFDELGTAHAVTRYLQAESHPARHPPPRRAESGQPRMAAGPGVSTVYRILAHPAYAGTYAYGRTPIEPKRRRRNGQPGIRRAPMEAQYPEKLPPSTIWLRRRATFPKTVLGDSH